MVRRCSGPWEELVDRLLFWGDQLKTHRATQGVPADLFAAVWNSNKTNLSIFTYLNVRVNQLWCRSLSPASHLLSQNNSIPHPRKKLEFLLAEFTAECGSPELRQPLSPLEAFCCCFKRKLHILGRLWSYYQAVTTGRHEQNIIIGFKDEGSVDVLRSIRELWLSET